jgi:putative ABC transport system substrate-binding protein
LETPTLFDFRRQIADLAAKLRLFANYTSRDFVDAGGLMSYAADRRQQYRRAAELVAKILDGEKPASIQLRSHRNSSLSLISRQPGCSASIFPLKLLATADEVIE